jgi:hypothetical protein
MELVVNLNRAQKYITRMKKHIAGIQQPAGYINLNDRLNSSTVESLQVFIDEKKEELSKYRETRLILQTDLNAIKQAVFKANLSSGISDILVQIEEVNFQINLLSQLGKSGDLYSTVTTEGLQRMIDKSYLSGNNYISLINSSFFDEKIKELRKELENQRDKLNANTEIRVKVSAVTSEVLGLN